MVAKDFQGDRVQQYLHIIWVFPKIWIQRNGWFIMENPISMACWLANWMIWGHVKQYRLPKITGWLVGSFRDVLFEICAFSVKHLPKSRHATHLEDPGVCKVIVCLTLRKWWKWSHSTRYQHTYCSNGSKPPTTNSERQLETVPIFSQSHHSTCTSWGSEGDCSLDPSRAKKCHLSEYMDVSENSGS